jgi:hypothetical protein
MITLTADITFASGGDPTYSGALPLTIEGDGYTLDANGSSTTPRRVLYAPVPAGVKITLTNVTVTGGYSTSAGGGGVYVPSGDLVVYDSTVSNNRGVDGGGLTATPGELRVVNSEIIGNIGADDTGGLMGGDVTIIGSTVADNEARGYRGEGAGVFGESVTVINSTITGNTLTNGTGGIGGGGILSRGPLELIHSTVTGNSAHLGANVRVSNDADLTSFGSVIAEPLRSASCSIDGATISTYSYDDDGSCGFTDATDVSGGGDPVLAPLANNGGTTRTRLPDGATSPLVDVIPTADCSTEVTTDQRGIPRPQGLACDIGATEMEGANIIAVVEGRSILFGDGGEQFVSGQGWTEGDDVDLYINGAYIATSTATQNDEGSATPFYDVDALGVLIEPGDQLTLVRAGDNHTENHVVAVLTLKKVKTNKDTVAGGATPGSDVIVFTGEARRNETVDEKGRWLADFSVPGDEPDEDTLQDITDDSVGFAVAPDADGNVTALFWAPKAFLKDSM